jgi:hypothetical protein
MTTKTDSFPTIQNPLSGHWATVNGGLQCTASGIVKGSGVSPQDNLSSWSTGDYTFLNNQTAAITVSNLGAQDWPGVTVRTTGTGATATGYVLYALQEISGINLYKLVAGSIGSGSTNLIQSFTGLTLTGTHTMELDIAGTTWTVKWDGVTQGTGTDASYATGQPGMAYEFGNSNASQINSFTATDAGGASTATIAWVR